jgi:hypothetical protein
MRIGFVLVIVIIALMAVGGLSVDEYYIRQENENLVTNKQQMEEQLAAAQTQINQLTSEIRAYQAQIQQLNQDRANWEQQKAKMEARIVELQAQVQSLQARTINEIESAPISRTEELIKFSSVGGIIIVSLVAGLLSMKKPRQANLCYESPLKKQPGIIALMVTESEKAQIINLRRKK